MNTEKDNINTRNPLHHRYSEPLPDEVLHEIRQHRDAIISALVTHGRVVRSLDDNAPEATISDLLSVVDGQILGKATSAPMPGLAPAAAAGGSGSGSDGPGSAGSGLPVQNLPPASDEPVGVRCRDDFRTGDKNADSKRASDFIRTYGLQAFKDLPQHAPCNVDLDNLTGDDLETWSVSDKTALINKIGYERFAQICAKRRPIPPVPPRKRVDK